LHDSLTRKMDFSKPVLLCRSVDPAKFVFSPFWESKDPLELNFWLLLSSKFVFFFFLVNLSLTLLSFLATTLPLSFLTSCKNITAFINVSLLHQNCEHYWGLQQLQTQQFYHPHNQWIVNLPTFFLSRLQSFFDC